MYETHFGLRQRPFPAIADGKTYYPATSHERALAQLQQAIQDEEGFALLTGEPGTGNFPTEPACSRPSFMISAFPTRAGASRSCG
jgi:type II secretory pathway predicted ATPase ExeA